MTDTPTDVVAAIDASDYPGEAAERLVAARGITFPEAFRLIKEWQGHGDRLEREQMDHEQYLYTGEHMSDQPDKPTTAMLTEGMLDCFGYRRWTSTACRRCGYEPLDCHCGITVLPTDPAAAKREAEEVFRKWGAGQLT